MPYTGLTGILTLIGSLTCCKEANALGMKLDEINFNKVFHIFSASHIVGALGNFLIEAVHMVIAL